MTTRETLNTPTFGEALVMFMFAKPASRLFSRVIGRAHERGFINSEQLHDIHGIWNRLVLGQ